MDCYCDYDGDPPEFIREKVVRARKTHRCRECGCDIRAGDQYESVVGKWDERIERIATCDWCFSFRRWYEANRPCFCWAYGEVFQAVRDDVDEAGDVMVTEAPGFLFEVGRRYVKIRNRARVDREARKAAKLQQPSVHGSIS